MQGWSKQQQLKYPEGWRIAKEKNSAAHKGQVPWNKGKTKADFPQMSNSGAPKGKPSWNKGKELSKEHRMALRKKHKPLSMENRMKMSARMKGKKLSLETRHKMSLGQKGEKGSNWQGGKTALHDTLRRSLKYREWRKSVFERDDYVCQSCEKRGGNLNADHIKPFALYPSLRFDLFNGRTLCVPCHRQTETYGINQYTNAV